MAFRIVVLAFRSLGLTSRALRGRGRCDLAEASFVPHGLIRPVVKISGKGGNGYLGIMGGSRNRDSNIQWRLYVN